MGIQYCHATSWQEQIRIIIPLENKKTRRSEVFNNAVNGTYTMPIVRKILTTNFENCKYHVAKIHKNDAIVSLSSTVFLQMLLPASIS